ncbi:hypothetical protein A2686_05300 [Candidatus Woesebacteria bacterium RIFCSPHIGHO2_01_FULL_38_10]|nr:MAG: hypothetical protein A2686_05300 [Candidatus Woesebacteria bacterium RIFCSPHIGHO2_01_FULL_38_10]
MVREARIVDPESDEEEQIVEIAARYLIKLSKEGECTPILIKAGALKSGKLRPEDIRPLFEEDLETVQAILRKIK